MKRTFVLAITIFCITLSNAQITDSKRDSAIVNMDLLTKEIDTTIVTNRIDSLKVDQLKLAKKIDSTKLEFDNDSLKKDTIVKLNFVQIRKSLLDSLLKPFYKINIDTLYNIKIKNDTVTKDTVFYHTDYIPKYRLFVNSFSQDSSFIPFPKLEQQLFAKYDFSVDVLDIKTPVQQVKMNKLDYVRDTAWWVNKSNIGLDIHQVAFLNWNAGGVNSIAGILKIYLGKTYKKQFTLWENEILARYGLNKQADRELRKTDDQFRINSTFGFRKNAFSHWYYTVKFNFYTQFTDGYKYPDVDNPISRFFAPAYMFLGAGARYNLAKKHFSIYLSPITLKSTYVFDDELSNNGDFGVTPGERSRHEFGVLVQTSWDTELFKNVAMMNRLGIYSDYLNNFGNVDFNWDLKFKFKVNSFLEANIAAQVLYDDDIKYKEDTNGDGKLETFPARIQLKQQLGIGILYKF